MSIATEIQRLRTAKADIKTAIEEKGVEVGDGLIDTYAKKISEISVGGGDVIDLARYTKVFQLTSINVFNSSEAVLNLDNVTSLNNLLSSSVEKNTTVKHLTINCPQQVTGISWLMSLESKFSDEFLERLTFNVDISKVKSAAYMLRNVRSLKVIDGQALDFSNFNEAATVLFDTVPALEELRVVKESIKVSISFPLPSASNETIQSIFDGLAKIETTQTVKFSTQTKILQSQVDNANAKGWTVAGGTVVSEEEYYA